MESARNAIEKTPSRDQDAIFFYLSRYEKTNEKAWIFFAILLPRDVPRRSLD